MFNLFYASGTSAMAPHILLETSHLNYSLSKVNLDTKTWKKGNYDALNEKSYVPLLQISDQTYLSECAIILEYIDVHSNNQFSYEYNSKDYWQLRSWLNYIATELHKNFISPFRNGNWLPNTEDSKSLVWQRVKPRLSFIDSHFENPWLTGSKFTIADPYLFVMTNWMRRLNYPITNFKNLDAFDKRMRNLSNVKKVLEVEGAPHSLLDN